MKLSELLQQLVNQINEMGLEVVDCDDLRCLDSSPRIPISIKGFEDIDFTKIPNYCSHRLYISKDYDDIDYDVTRVFVIISELVNTVEFQINKLRSNHQIYKISIKDQLVTIKHYENN